MKYDVVVVGAGPAGSVTALTIAENCNKNVLLVDKRKTVGVPINCAGGILKKWANLSNISIPKKCIASKIDGATLISPGGIKFHISKEMILPGEDAGYVMYRDKFDQYLVEEAVKKGVVLKLNTKIKSISDCKDYIKPHGYIVCADGYASKVGLSAGIDTKISNDDMHVGLEYTIENDNFDDKYIRFYLGIKQAYHGYVWMFPEGKNRIKVGLGVPKSIGGTKILLKKFLNKHPECNGKIVNKIGGMIPTAKPLKYATVGDRILLVGDAARHTVPSSGAGIATALIGGREAGKVIANDLPARVYDRAWKKKIGRMLKTQYMFKKVAYKWNDSEIDRVVSTIHSYKLMPITEDNIIREIPRLMKHIAFTDPRLFGTAIIRFLL